MATAVLDLDLLKLPSEVIVPERYTKAFILVRFKGRPIGRTILPVYNGQITHDVLHDGLFYAVKSTLWTSWLHDYLAWDERSINNYAQPTATVAICTRDRPQDLRRCLDALMQLPDDGQEILVIDNCPSTDETRKLVESYRCIRYVLESQPGLNNARNRALKEARNEIVAFTDDDATPEPNWLRALLRNFNNPLVLCVTGMTMPLELETEGQELFERYSPFGRGFQRKVYSSITGNPLATGPVGAGANMALRQNVQYKVGNFDEALDAGTPTQSGGDHEFFSRILIAGYQIVYEPAALSWHRHRRTLQETHKAIKGYGIGVYAFWMRTLFVQGELGILKFPWHWFFQTQLPNLIRAVLRRPGSFPLSLLITELHGCLIGPWAYFKVRRQMKRKNKLI